MVGGLAVHAIRSNIREQAKQLKIGAIALGIGDNKARSPVAERCHAAGLAIVQAVHPRPTAARSAQIGTGVAIMAGSPATRPAPLREMRGASNLTSRVP